MEQQQKSLEEQLCRGFSRERLAAYHQNGDERAVPLTRYLWNMALAESLYPALGCLEIALRNSIHVAITVASENSFWFDDPLLLRSQELTAVSAAKHKLLDHRKPLEPGRIIAELTFGFWTALFNDRYDVVLWPRFLKAVFPEMPRQLRTRINLSRQLNKIRYLRNRVFHYEPIWHWSDLRRQHDGIIEVTSWLNGVAAGLAEAEDRFVDVYQGGPQRYHAAVATILAQYDEGKHPNTT